MKIYITGSTVENDSECKTEFKQAEQALTKLGYTYYNSMNGINMQELNKCDGILLLGGWSANKDAIEATASAETHNIKRYYGIDQISKMPRD